MIRHPAFRAPILIAVMLLASCGSENTGPVDSPRPITTPFLPDAFIGTAYAQVLAAECPASATPAWNVSEGTLPPGLALDGASIAGMATAAGHYEFTIRVSCKGIGEKDFVMDVLVPPTLTILILYPGDSLPFGRMTQPYEARLFASGGTGGTVHFRISSGTLPEGISLSAGGTFSGTPTGPPGRAPFTIEATQGSLTATLDASLSIRPPPLVISAGAGTQLPDATVGIPYTTSFQATGGGQPYRWYVVTEMPTSSIEMTELTGELAFTPTTAGEYDIIVIVADDFDATQVTVRVKVVDP